MLDSISLSTSEREELKNYRLNDADFMIKRMCVGAHDICHNVCDDCCEEQILTDSPYQLGARLQAFYEELGRMQDLETLDDKFDLETIITCFESHFGQVGGSAIGKSQFNGRVKAVHQRTADADAAAISCSFQTQGIG